MLKCVGCGLVNFPDAVVCRRCGVNLGGTDPGSFSSSGWTAWQGDGVTPDGRWQPGASGQGATGSSQSSGSIYNGPPVYGQPSFQPYRYGYSQYTLPAIQHAGRVERLVAAILDTFFIVGAIVLIVVPAAVLDGGNGAVIATILLGLLGVSAVAVAQLVLLSTRGQTIGKKIMRIRIVKQETLENGGFATNVLMRGIVPGLIGLVPYVGPLFSIVDKLFIFGEERRCIHDLIAGTIVIAES